MSNSRLASTAITPLRLPWHYDYVPSFFGPDMVDAFTRLFTHDLDCTLINANIDGYSKRSRGWMHLCLVRWRRPLQAFKFLDIGLPCDQRLPAEKRCC